MASLTIRKLDDAIRDELRLRAARNGRSVEDEVRVILREASRHRLPAAAPATAEVARVDSDAGAGLPRVTLIIGGNRRLQGTRPDPPAERTTRSRPLCADPGRAAVRHAADRQRPFERALFH